jgi:hypothetical protein
MVFNILVYPQMHTVTFTYRGKQCNGYIASSTIKEPHFHWLFFTDPWLTEITGDDSVAFQEIDRRLVHFNRIPLACNDLVEIARIHIEEYLKNSRASHK